MRWLAPWAWLGLASIAVPVLLHLLGRPRPVPLLFSSLRFIRDARPSPARRRRLNDVPLLLVRIAALVAAVAAVAQPLFVGAPRAAESRVVRAIVVDTSASMQTGTPAGVTGADVARTRAASASAGAAEARTIDAPDLRAGLRLASAWLAGRSGTRELAIISDFQTGAIDETWLREVPRDIGIAFDAVATNAPTDVTRPAQLWAGQRVDTLGAITPAGVNVTWRASATSPARAPLRVFAAPSESAAVEDAWEAARAQGIPASTTRPVAVLFPASTERQSLLASAHAIDAPWMSDLTNLLRHDATLVTFARDVAASSQSQAPDAARAVPVLMNSEGRAVLSAVAAPLDGTSHLLLVTAHGPDDVFATALLAATSRAAVETAPDAEWEPGRISAETLAKWTRPSQPTAAPPAVDGTRSDGRWFWLICLVLLGVETWMRRGNGDVTRGDVIPAPASRTEASNARVA